MSLNERLSLIFRSSFNKLRISKNKFKKRKLINLILYLIFKFLIYSIKAIINFLYYNLRLK